MPYRLGILTLNIAPAFRLKFSSCYVKNTCKVPSLTNLLPCIYRFYYKKQAAQVKRQQAIIRLIFNISQTRIPSEKRLILLLNKNQLISYNR